MKKILTLLMTLVLCIAMMAPQFAMPADVLAIDEQAGPYTDNTEEYVMDPLMTVRFTDLYNNKLLTIPESMNKVGISTDKGSGGLYLSGKSADLTSGRITIAEEFDFGTASVGRLSFDGLRDKKAGMNVQIGIYLDNDAEPVAKVDLRKQMGSNEWSNDGEQCVDLIGNEITGKHKVSIGIIISGNVPKSTSVLLRSIEFCATEIPVMYFHIDESEGSIDAMNNSSDHSVECYGSVDLRVPESFNEDETFRDEYSQQDSINGIELEYIRGRGNSTWDSDKKPYKVKFDKARNLFSFGKNKHWILLANRYDNSLVRNRMTYWLGQKLGMEYTPQCVPVEVVMNGRYYGSYLLCEQIRVGEGRVDIPDLDDEENPILTDEFVKTGGYLLSMEWEDSDEAEQKRGFVTDRGMQFYIESPKERLFDEYKEVLEGMNAEEVEGDQIFRKYIQTFVQKVEDALFGTNFMNENGVSYHDLLDMQAAVDYWWIQEFSENGDAYLSGSTYLYKKRGNSDGGSATEEKLYWGPLWDFDYVAWGDLDYGGEPVETLTYTSNKWSARMLRDSVFTEMARTRWSKELKEEATGVNNYNVHLKDLMEEVTKEGGLLDKYEKQLERSYIYDHEKYGPFESEITEYSGEIEQLRTWIIRRSEMVDDLVKNIQSSLHTVKYVLDGNVIREESVADGSYVSEMPEVPKKKGDKVFIGWVDEYGQSFSEEREVYSDLVLTAFYVNKSSLAKPKALYFEQYEATCMSGAYSFADNTYRQEYKIMPEDAYNDKITWTTSDSNIAEVIDEYGNVILKGSGDVVITATLSNGVHNSYTLHILDSLEEYHAIENVTLSKSSLKLKTGGFDQIRVNFSPQPCSASGVMWFSLDEDIASVDDMGIVKGITPGTTTLVMISSGEYGDQIVLTCKVTVTEKKGDVFNRKGSEYKVLSTRSGSRKVKLIRGADAASVAVPAYIKIGGRKYNVTSIGAGAFKKSKATKLTVKTKKLTKSSVKKSLKGSKVKTIKISTGKTSVNRKYVKKYKTIFTKKNAGKKVKVK